MAYKWTKDDIDVVRKYMREENGKKAAVTRRMLELVPTLQKSKIAVAIKIAQAHINYEKGQLPLSELRQFETKLNL